LPDVNLCFVGDGQLRPILTQFCISHKLLQYVHFLGNLPHHKALQVVAKSSVFVLSSYEEGLPTALIEAMAFGKPVVATNVGGVSEVIKDGINGILVPPKSPEKLAESIEQLLCNSQLGRELSETASRSVKGYSWNKIAESYLKVYQMCFNKRFK
jgi:glycosyltransferase involved in cell wall biosynthesis